mgnify:CR=1 FL=1
MTRLIHRQAAVLLACLIALTALIQTHPVSAQSEGIDIEHSPNAKRALRLHGEKRASIEAYFLASLDMPVERFLQASERHVKRYTAALDRDIRTLTREGNIEEASAVLTAIKRTEDWVITPPNDEGIHFLSQANLQVEGNDSATKLGVDLQVNIEKAGVAYAEQVDRAFKQYRAKVQLARNGLVDELTKIMEQEQRAGRLEAVQEVQKAIDTIKKLPEVDKPESPKEPEADPAIEFDEQIPGLVPALPDGRGDKLNIHDDLLGYYQLGYLDDNDVNRQTIIELRSDRALVRGQYTRTKLGEIASYDAVSAVEMTMTKGKFLTWRFKENTGRTLIAKVEITEQNNKTFISRFNSKIAYAKPGGGSTTPTRCVPLRFGALSDAMEDFSEGTYHFNLEMRRNEDGKATNGAITFQVELNQDTFLIVGRTSPRNRKVLDPVIPIAFRSKNRGEDVISYAEYDYGRRRDMFVIRTLNDGSTEVQYWWDSADYGKGQPADAFGKLEKRH